MRRAANAIAPELEDGKLTLTSGSLELTLENGQVDTIRFRLSGSARIAVVETELSLEALLTLQPDGETAQAVPAAALAALQ